MLRMCVLTVFTDTDSSAAISCRDRFVGRYRSTFSSPALISDPLDLPAAARFTGQGEERADPQVGHHLFQVPGGEVRAMVDVEGGRDPAHVPVRMFLAPDRLPECQRGVQRGGGAEG
jgi:hypothetical protein